MVGPTRNNIHATVGSITWDPHHRSNTQAGSIFYRQQVESASAEQCAYRKVSTTSLNATILVFLRVPPPLFLTKASQNLLPHRKRDTRCKYEGSSWPLKTTPFKRQIIFVSFRQLHFKVWDLVFLSANNWTAFSLIVSCFWMFRKPRVTWEEKQRAPLLDIERAGPRGRHLRHFSAGEMTLNCGPSAHA